MKSVKRNIVYIFYITLILFINSVNSFLFSQEKDYNEKKESQVKTTSMTIGNKTLSLQEAIAMVLNNNLTLQAAKYDVIMTDTEAMKFDKRYSLTGDIEGGYNYNKEPYSAMSALTGDKNYQWNALASLSKLFPSATSVSAGIKELYYDANDTGIPGMIPKQPPYHEPSFFISIKQELLKNAFGYSDRLQKDIINNSIKIQRAAIIDRLSALVVSALADYWSVTVRKSALDNAGTELQSDKEVRDIISRNARYGLAESYDLNQYNAIVAVAEANLASCEKEYRDAVRKFLRTVNLPPDTEVKGVTDLVDTLPPLDKDSALASAFKKRVDYRNALLDLENSRKTLSMYENNSLPSLTLSTDLTTIGQETTYLPAFKDSATGTYPDFEVNFKLSIPFDDTEQKANLRNAYLKIRQAEYNVENIKLELRDDVLSKLEGVEVQHTSLQKARTARSESELYYNKLLSLLRLGKINSVTMRLALDSMVQSRQQELEALVGYNLALLQFDLAKNEIFERYNVNVEKYLSSVKTKE